MKKKTATLCLVLGFLVLTGCGKSAPVEEKPELSPLCPEGFLWVDSTKSCEITPTL